MDGVWTGRLQGMMKWGESAGLDKGIALLFLCTLLSVLANGFNATLIFDDPFLYEHFATVLSLHGFFHTLGVLFFNFDLYVGVPEYRTYGLSKIVHFLLWFVFDNRPWLYSALIAATQGATACLLYRAALRMGGEQFQAFLMGMVWIFSPFIVTTCFHHYSYLILPVQLTAAVAYYVQGRLLNNVALTLGNAGCLLGMGSVLALTGEHHFVLLAVLLLWVACFTRSSLTHRERLAYIASVVMVLPVVVFAHRAVWGAFSPAVDVQRFNYAPPDLGGFFSRSFDFLGSIYPGAATQVKQVLSLSSGALFAFVFLAALLSCLLWRHARLLSLDSGLSKGQADVPVAYGGVRWMLALFWVFFASLAIVWVRAVFFSKVGDVLPRRYGYVPYTVFLVILVGWLAHPRMRRQISAWPAILCVAAVASLWGALQLICLPQVRGQDSAVWEKVREAMKSKQAPHVLFVSALNGLRPTGFDSPGLRGVSFPPIFESPFMRNGWQVAYARVALGAADGGDIFQPKGDSQVFLSGRLSGIHFVPASPVAARTSSVVVVMDEGYEPLDWRDGLGRVKVLGTWSDFTNTAAFLQARTEVGWRGLLTGIFNESSSEVAIDLGQRDGALGPGVLRDKLYAEPVEGNEIVANYGLESGDDTVYSPNGQAGIPLSYLTTNRHGAFTYRIDFKDAGPKLVSLDFLDWWADKPKARVMAVQIALGDRWIDAGRFDTYVIGKGDPVAIRFPVNGVETIRVRLTKDSSSNDIPFANGIRVKKLVGTEK